MTDYFTTLLGGGPFWVFLMTKPIGSLLCLLFCIVLALISRRCFSETKLYRVTGKILRIVIIAFIVLTIVELLLSICQSSLSDTLAYLRGDDSNGEYILIDDFLTFICGGQGISEGGIMLYFMQVFVCGPVILFFTVFCLISFLIQLTITLKERSKG